jgi:hypothetical protein
METFDWEEPMQLVFESWILLLYFDLLMRFRSFGQLYAVVAGLPLRQRPRPTYSVEILVDAIDFASFFYFRKVQCLQRSCAAIALLRRHGLRAEMVIGVQILPFRSHAWVEVDGSVVNDKTSVIERYSVIQRTQEI